MVYRDRFNEIPVKRFVTMENETERKEAQEQESKSSGLWNAALAIGAVAGTALLAWGANSLLSSDPDKDKKKMKQPGRKGKVMYRDDFEDSPKAYFLGLRQEKKNSRK